MFLPHPDEALAIEAPAPRLSFEDSLANRKLREAESLLRAATAMGRLGAWSVSVPGLDVTWSNEVCKIHEVPAGYKCSVQEGLAFYAPEHLPRIAAAFKACVEHGTPFDMELQIVTATGRRVWVRAIGQADRDPMGNIVRVLGAFQDISHSKALADERQRLADTLAETLEGLADGFFIVDREWRFVYANPEACRIMQRSHDSLIGRRLWEQFPAAVGTAFQREYERAMREGVKVELVEHYSPLDLWVRVRAWPTASGLAVSFVDISAQKQAEAKLLELNADLEERVQQRTRELHESSRELEALSYAIAHDVRAPLASINGFGKALEERDGAQLSTRGKHYLQRIRAATVRMEQMTEGLLALARLSSAELQREAVDLSSLSRELLRTLQSQDIERDVVRIVQPELTVQADRTLLRILMSNLLGNAWKFSAGKSPAHIEVGTALLETGETACFVRDNGVGFDAEHAAKLFKPFHRLHSATEFPGTGIGLAAVQKIVRLHGGRVWAESAPDGGATFYFTLPTA